MSGVRGRQQGGWDLGVCLCVRVHRWRHAAQAARHWLHRSPASCSCLRIRAGPATYNATESMFYAPFNTTLQDAYRVGAQGQAAAAKAVGGGGLPPRPSGGSEAPFSDCLRTGAPATPWRIAMLLQGSSTFYYVRCYYLCNGNRTLASIRGGGSMTVVSATVHAAPAMPAAPQHPKFAAAVLRDLPAMCARECFVGPALQEAPLAPPSPPAPSPPPPPAPSPPPSPPPPPPPANFFGIALATISAPGSTQRGVVWSPPSNEIRVRRGAQLEAASWPPRRAARRLFRPCQD